MQLLGQYLGRYHLLQSIASGGMGEVYLGQDPLTDRHVAIKVIRMSVLHSSEAQDAIRRFERETKLIAKLNHPHILPLLDTGEQNINGIRVLYLVMPLQQDGSLKQWLSQPNILPLSPEKIVPLLDQAADALQYAHDMDIIHRDIKPENLLIRMRKDVYTPDLLLADFGNASLMNATISPEVRGTPIYMAPEQWENKPPVQATDQYALAIMTYEMLTGRPPFSRGLSFPEYYDKHVNEQPLPPSRINPHLTKDIDEVLLRALEKNPMNRFQSVKDFSRAFREAAEGKNSFLDTAALSTTKFNQLLQAPKLIKMLIAVSAIFGLVLYTVNPLLAIPSIPYIGLVLVAIAWLLGLGQTAWFRQWNWFTAILLLSPFAGIVYGLVGPIRRPQSVRVLAVVRTLQELNKERRPYLYGGVLVVIIAEIIGISVYTNYASGRAYYEQIAPGKEATYASLTNSNPSLSYSLVSNASGNYKWEERADCTFAAQAYHVSDNTTDNTSSTPPDNFNSCYLQNSNFNNFAFQVQLVIISGGFGGILFRNSGGSNGFFYVFRIGVDGSYELRFYLNKQSDNYNVLSSGNTDAFNNGLGKLNTIGIVAKSDTIDLYINHHYIDEVEDNSSERGAIALLAASYQLNTAEVVYNNAEIWTLV